MGGDLGQISVILILWSQGRGGGLGQTLGMLILGEARGLGTDMGMFILWGVGEFWDRHWGC